jgi:hypothetical protein
MASRARKPANGSTNLSTRHDDSSTARSARTEGAPSGDVMYSPIKQSVHGAAPAGEVSSGASPMRTDSPQPRSIRGPPAPVYEGYASIPGVTIATEAEAHTRKVRSIVAGLRSKFWGKRGAISETFQKWDVDGSGTLDAEELGAALVKLGYNAGIGEARTMVAAFCGGQTDGTVPYEDFVSILCGDQALSTAVTLPDGPASAFALHAGAPSTVAAARAALNLGTREVYVWGGRAAKKLLGVEEFNEVRGTGSVSDLSRGAGNDVLAEALRRRSERAEAGLRSASFNVAEEVGAGAFSPSPTFRGAATATIHMGHSALPPPRGSPSSPGAPGPAPLLRDTNVRQRAAEQEGMGAIPVPPSEFDGSLHTAAHVPAPRVPPPQSVVGSEEYGLTTARRALPGGIAYDPAAAAPATGTETLVVGRLAAWSPLRAQQRRVEADIVRVRLAGRLPLEGSFASEGADSGAVAAVALALGHTPASSAASSRRESGAGGLMPADHARASDRAAAGRLRNQRLSHRAIDFAAQAERDGKPAPVFAAAASPYDALSLAERMLQSKADKRAALGMVEDDAAGAAPPGQAALLSVAKEKAQFARQAASAAASRFSDPRNNGDGDMGFEEMAGCGRRDSLMSRASSAAPPASVRSRPAATLLPSSAMSPANLVRIARHEAQNTRSLIAPDAGTGSFAAAAAEPPDWHYASASRLAQTFTPVPEQLFPKLAQAERRQGARRAQSAWEEQLKATEVKNADFLDACTEQRVSRKREEKAAYGVAIAAHKGRLEIALFGSPSPVIF